MKVGHGLEKKSKKKKNVLIKEDFAKANKCLETLQKPIHGS